MDIGKAIGKMKKGLKVSREGWNGKGMFLYYVAENSYPVDRNKNSAVQGVFEGDMVPYSAYIAMKTAQGVVSPWFASQFDLLAEDWEVCSVKVRQI